MANHKGRAQVAQILEYMKTGKHITPLEALKLFDCFRLSARINDIERDGETISRRTIRRKTAGGKNKHYTEYWLEVGK